MTTELKRYSQLVTPVGIFADWSTVLAAGLIATADAATITNPATQIASLSSRIIELPATGATSLFLALGYDAALTPGTSPVVVVFGRYKDIDGNVGRWTLMPTASGSRTITLTPAATTDTSDGTLKWSQMSAVSAAVATRGFNQFVVGVQVAFTGTGGTIGLSRVDGLFQA